MNIGVACERAPNPNVICERFEATPFRQEPHYLIHGLANNYGKTYAHVATSSGITLLKTPYRAPKANAICERFMGSLRRECLDHMLILNPAHLQRVVMEYTAYFNRARPPSGHRSTHTRIGSISIYRNRFSR